MHTTCVNLLAGSFVTSDHNFFMRVFHSRTPQLFWGSVGKSSVHGSLFSESSVKVARWLQIASR
jgi:hypothetical protein